MSEPVVRLLIELEEIEPRIWRRVDVPAGATLAALHDVIQAVMRWQHAHLYEFQIGNRTYGNPLPGEDTLGHRVYQAKGLCLDQLIHRGIEHFTYVYDFGDDWRHHIRIEGRRNGDAGVDYPRFVDGEHRAPPEDVGGVPGFLDFLEALADPNHPEHDHLRTWAGGDFDTSDIDRRSIECDLAMLAEFRRRAMAGHRKRVWQRVH